MTSPGFELYGGVRVCRSPRTSLALDGSPIADSPSAASPWATTGACSPCSGGIPCEGTAAASGDACAVTIGGAVASGSVDAVQSSVLSSGIVSKEVLAHGGGDASEVAKLKAEVVRLRDSLKREKSRRDVKAGLTVSTYEEVSKRKADAACTYAIEELQAQRKNLCEINDRLATLKATLKARRTEADGVTEADAEDSATLESEMADIALEESDIAKKIEDLREELNTCVADSNTKHALRVNGALLELEIRREELKLREAKDPVLGALEDKLGHERAQLRNKQTQLRDQLSAIREGDAVLHLSTPRAPGSWAGSWEGRVGIVERLVQPEEAGGEPNDDAGAEPTETALYVVLRGAAPDELIRQDQLLLMNNDEMALRSAEEADRRALWEEEERVAKEHAEESRLEVEEAEERVKELAEEVLSRAGEQGPALKRTASDLSVLPKILDGVTLDEEERHRGLRYIRECMEASQQALDKMHEALASLMAQGTATSRAGYLRTLQEYIGPKPAHKTWKEEWVPMRIEYQKAGGKLHAATEESVIQSQTVEHVAEQAAKQSIQECAFAPTPPSWMALPYRAALPQLLPQLAKLTARSFDWLSQCETWDGRRSRRRWWRCCGRTEVRLAAR